jgi:hypothetical protein
MKRMSFLIGAMAAAAAAAAAADADSATNSNSAAYRIALIGLLLFNKYLYAVTVRNGHCGAAKVFKIIVPAHQSRLRNVNRALPPAPVRDIHLLEIAARMN